MPTRYALAFLLSVFTVPSFARIPVMQLTSGTQAQLAMAQQALELRSGRALSREERDQLGELIREEPAENLIYVSNQDPSKAIYCVGSALGGIFGFAGADCVHLGSLQTYSLQMVGVGASTRLENTAFRLKVSFDPTRYHEDFDPIPGEYAAITEGATLGTGYTIFRGDAGNKTLSGFGVTFGAGLDFGTVSHMRITP